MSRCAAGITTKVLFPHLHPRFQTHDIDQILMRIGGAEIGRIAILRVKGVDHKLVVELTEQPRYLF